MKDIFYEFKRKRAKKKITGNQGVVIETEDKLICYVKKSKCRIEKPHSDYKNYHISCLDYKEEHKDLVEKYNLNKRIIYVLDSLTFNEDEFIEIESSTNCEVQIINCEFNYNIEISILGKCTLRNTIINLNWTSNTIRVTDLVLHNTNISSNNASVYIDAKNSVEMNKSKIEGKDLRIDSKKITSTNSRIIGTNDVILNVEEFNKLNITSESTKYNGINLRYKETSFCLKKLNLELGCKRQELLSRLRSIKANLKEHKAAIVAAGIDYDKQPIGGIHTKIRKKSLNLTSREQNKA